MVDYNILLNKMIDNHQVTELLGQGGMGAVFKAYDHYNKRWEALKIINPRLLTQPDLIQQFQQEAEAATGLHHYNIAQLYSIGSFQNVPYYTMEFIEGKSFAEIQKEKGRIAGSTCMNYLYQICNGLEYCQFNGIIHRDIKPANLMISSDGIVKVVDFGLAMILGEGSRSQESEQILGTPKYISPEAGTTKILDHRSDIYSLGATFYHMMTGVPPFDAPTPLDLLNKHIEEPLIPMYKQNPIIPVLVSDIIAKMMEKNPKNRYQSYKDLKGDIDAAKSSGFQRTKTSQLIAQPAPGIKKEKKKKPPVLFIAGALLVVIVAAIFFIVFGSRTKKVENSNPVPSEPGLDISKIKNRGITSTPSKGREQGVPPLHSGIARAERAETMSRMRTIFTLASQHYMENGEWPGSTDQLIKDKGLPMPPYDSWGNMIIIEALGMEEITIISGGEDGITGTADDIILKNGIFIK